MDCKPNYGAIDASQLFLISRTRKS